LTCMAGVLERSEVKVLIALALLAILWSVVGIPAIIGNPTFISFNPIFQYVLLNLSFILLFVVVIGTGVTIAVEKEYNYSRGIANGIAAWLSFSFVMDNWSPPFVWDMAGHQAVTGAGVTSSVDYVWGYILINIFPSIANTPVVFFFVYGIVPVVATLLAALILTKGQFLKWLGFGGGK
jgi:hypothetical protein